MKPVRMLSIAAILIGIGGVALALRLAAVATAETDQQRALADLIAPHGFVLEPVTGTQGLAGVVNDPVGAERAAAIAVTAYGKGKTPIVHEGILTLSDFEPAIVRRPVYVVQLTGMNLHAFGRSQEVHDEQLVFVDASTGAELIAITIR